MLGLISIFSSLKISLSSSTPGGITNKEKIFEPVIRALYEGGVDSAFVVGLVNNPSTQFDKRFVKINVTGYLNKTDYSGHYSDYSVKRSLDFYNENIDLLSLCELKFKVPKEIVTSILWIETRHGNYLGKSHVPSVFLSTALADQPDYLEMNLESFKETYEDDSEELKNFTKLINERAIKKREWALKELHALSILDTISPIPPSNLYGSWAGAFGIAQFLPSSYVKWAYDGNGDGVINLFEMEDAVYSVANYLKCNGWGDSEEKQRGAVFHYNNSTAYVDAVLKLAEKIKSRT